MEERFSMTQQGVTESNGDNNAGTIEKRSSVTSIVTESIYRDNQMHVTDNITRLAHKSDNSFCHKKTQSKYLCHPNYHFAPAYKVSNICIQIHPLAKLIPQRRKISFKSNIQQVNIIPSKFTTLQNIHPSTINTSKLIVLA